jgi:hypothetical protein
MTSSSREVVAGIGGVWGVYCVRAGGVAVGFAGAAEED